MVGKRVRIKSNDIFIVTPKYAPSYICKAIDNRVIILTGEMLPGFKEYFISLEFANDSSFQENNIRIINTRYTKLGRILYK